MLVAARRVAFENRIQQRFEAGAHLGAEIGRLRSAGAPGGEVGRGLAVQHRALSRHRRRDRVERQNGLALTGPGRIDTADVALYSLLEQVQPAPTVGLQFAVERRDRRRTAAGVGRRLQTQGEIELHGLLWNPVVVLPDHEGDGRRRALCMRPQQAGKAGAAMFLRVVEHDDGLASAEESPHAGVRLQLLGRRVVAVEDDQVERLADSRARSPAEPKIATGFPAARFRLRRRPTRLDPCATPRTRSPNRRSRRTTRRQTAANGRSRRRCERRCIAPVTPVAALANPCRTNGRTVMTSPSLRRQRATGATAMVISRRV